MRDLSREDRVYGGAFVAGFAFIAIVAGTAPNPAGAQAQAQGYFGEVLGGGEDSQFLNQPFMFAIDTDGNGEISADEIERSVQSLSAAGLSGPGGQALTA